MRTNVKQVYTPVKEVYTPVKAIDTVKRIDTAPKGVNKVYSSRQGSRLTRRTTQPTIRTHTHLDSATRQIWDRFAGSAVKVEANSQAQRSKSGLVRRLRTKDAFRLRKATEGGKTHG